MSDVTDKYSIDFETNADQATRQVRSLSATLDEMGRSGELSSKGLNQASRGVLSIEKAIGSSTGSVKRYSDAFSSLRKEAAQAEQALQRAAQASVSRGRTNPLGSAANSLSIDEARRFDAINRASNLSLQQAAQERIRLEDRLTAAKARSAAEERKLVNLGRDRKVVAEENLAAAQRELQAASRQKSSLGSGGGRHGGGAATIGDQVAAEERLAAAKKGVTDAQRQLNSVNQDGANGYVALRYAMYDVSSTALSLSAALTGAGVAAASAFASQESAFTSVERTLQAGVVPSEVQAIQDSLKELSTQVPITFNDLSSIATIGNQMGIGAESIVDFTGTISRFAAVTGISVEEVTKSFGGFMAQTGLAPEKLENLGSAIAKVGIDSNATEVQILSLMREISAGGKGAGFTAQQITGLAGTMASLQVAPERARGALSTYFGTLNKAVANGGQDLENFAQVVGVTSDKLEQMVRNGQGNEVLRGFLEGLRNLDSVDTTRALDELGLAQLRVDDTFRRLSGSVQLYDRDQRNAATSFQQASELQRQYAFITDDLASKWTIFTNALTNAAAAVGAEVAPTFKGLLDVATNLLVALADFANTPVGEAMIRMAATVSILAAAVGAIVGVISLAGASALAFRFALQQIATPGLISSFSSLASAFTTTGTAAAGAAAGVRFLGAALKTLGRITVIGAVIYAVSELLFNTRESLIWVGDTFIWLADTVVNAMSKISPFLGVVGINTTQFLRDTGKNIKEWGETFPKTADQVDGAAGSVDEFNKILEDLNTDSTGMEDLGNGMDNIAGGAEKAAKEVRTLVDYANDLRSVWNRAFDIRFSGQQTMDTIQDSFQKLRDAAAASAARIKDLRLSMGTLRAGISELKSDIGILEYYLKIAREYGDTKRATALEAELAKKRAELAEKTAELTNKGKELKKEQESQSKTLVGNSQAARDNRKALLDLVAQYQEHIGKLAESGMSQDQLKKRTAELKEEFIRQATQLGFSRAQVDKYARAFDDVRVAINGVPKRVTVDTSGLGAAGKALAEFSAKAKTNLDRVSSSARGMSNALKGIPRPSPSGFQTYGDAAIRAAGRIGALAQVALYQAEIATMPKTATGIARMAQILAKILQLKATYGFRSGGYTGPGPAGAEAGVVHRGEYVIPKRDVNQVTGLPYADALGRLMGGAPSRSVAPASSAGQGGVAVVSLTAGTIQAIAQATGKAIYLDGKMIADASSDVYAHQYSVGAH